MKRAWWRIVVGVAAIMIVGLLYAWLFGDVELDPWWPLTLVVWVAVFGHGLSRLRKGTRRPGGLGREP